MLLNHNYKHLIGVRKSFLKTTISSENSQFLGDETSGLRGGLSKKGYYIYDYYISETKYIL